MPNLARFKVNGSASSPGGCDTTAGQTLTLQIEASSSLVRRVTFEVYDPTDSESPLASKNAPLLTLVGATSGQKVDAATPAATVTVTMPVSGAHSWIVRCLVNGGLDGRDQPSPDYVFERMIAIRNGARRKIVASEGTQYSKGGWADAQNDDVDAGGGGGGSGYVTFQDDGSALPSRTVANVVGPGATVTDVAGVTTITILAPAPGTAGQVQVSNGTSWVSGPLDLSDVDATTGKLPQSSLADAAGPSVFGRAGSGTGSMAPIPANSDGHFLQRVGGALSFAAATFALITGTLNPNQLAGGTAVGQLLRNTAGNVPAWGAADLADGDAVTGTLAPANGGTGIAGAGGTSNRVLVTTDGSSWTASQVALGTMVSGLLPLANFTGGSAVGQVLRNTAGNVPGWGPLDLADGDAVTGQLPFGNFATIATDRLLGRDTAGTGSVEAISVDATFAWSGTGSIGRAALTGDVTAAAGSNTTAIAAGVIVNADINSAAAIAASKLAGGSAVGQVLLNAASNVPTWGALDLADGDAVTGLLPVTNLASLAARSVLGRAINSLGAMSAISGAGAGSVLVDSGSAIGFGDPNFGSRNITTTGAIHLGNNPATLGHVRIANGAGSADGVQFLHSDGITNVRGLALSSGNTLVLGDASTSGYTIATSAVHQWLGGGATLATLSSTVFELGPSVVRLRFDAATSAPVILVESSAAPSATGTSIMLSGQDMTGTGSTVGGAALVRAGDSTNGTGGALDIRSGAGLTPTQAGAVSISIGGAPFLSYPGNVIIPGNGVLRMFHNALVLTGRDTSLGTRSLIRWGVTANNVLNLGDSTVATTVLNGASVQVAAGSSNTMFEVTSLATNRDVIALFGGGTLTTTQMPANTGDGVIFWAPRTAEPTVPPGAPGLIAYATAAGELQTVDPTSSMAMRLGAGIGPIILKAGGAVDYSVYMEVPGATHQFHSGFVHFDDSVGTGSGEPFLIKYQSAEHMRLSYLAGVVSMSFFGKVATVGQAADPGGLTMSVGTADGTVSDVGASFSQGTLNNNFRELVNVCNNLRAIVRGLGFAA